MNRKAMRKKLSQILIGAILFTNIVPALGFADEAGLNEVIAEANNSTELNTVSESAINVSDNQAETTESAITETKKVRLESAITEDFEKAELTGAYASGNFTGEGDIEWQYVSARKSYISATEDYSIDGKGILLGKPKNGEKGSLTSCFIENGLQSVSLQYKKAFTGKGNRQIEILVNNQQVAISDITTDDQVHDLVASNLNIQEACVVSIRMVGDGQVTIDNIRLEPVETGGEGPTRAQGVVANPAGGEVLKGTKVTLTTSEESGLIHYTMDGSEPTAESAIYTEPIEIKQDMTIKAITVKAGLENSFVMAQDYILKKENLSVNISEIRKVLDKLAAGGKDAQPYTIQGTIMGIVGNGLSVAVQDETGSVIVRMKTSNPDLQVGQRIRAKGTAQNFNFLGQLNATENVEIIDVTAKPVEALPLNLKDMGEKYEAALIQAKELTVTGRGEKNVNSGNYDVYASDFEGHVIVIRVEAKDIADDFFKEGNTYTVTGIVGQFAKKADEGYQIIPRSKADVLAVEVEDTVPPTIVHEEIKSANIHTDLLIKANVSDDRKLEKVELYYRTKGETAYKSLLMLEGNGCYQGAIAKSALDMKGLEYYIQASDWKNNVSTYPLDSKKPVEVKLIDEDIQGPTLKTQQPAVNQELPENQKLVVKLEWADPSGIDMASVALILDDMDMTTAAAIKEISTTMVGIEYTTDKALSKGTHQLKAVAKDKKGNITEKNWSFKVGKSQYKFYFGQLHSHTTLSDGQGTVDEAFKWAREKGKADFFAVTDHSNWFDNELDWQKSTKWKQLKDTADKYSQVGEYVAIPGYEMTWSGSTGGWGHINTFNTEWFESRSNKAMDLKAYYAKIAEDKTSISQLNHPGKTFGDFADFGFYSAAADKVVHLVEVGNGEGPIRGAGYFPSYEYYTRALDKGWHVAPSNNQDNHKAGWVTANEARTVILAETLDRESLFESIRQLRVYSTEDSNLEVMYKVNGEMMGAKLDKPSELNFEIEVNDPDNSDTIQKISIIADNGRVVASKEFDSNKVEWKLTLAPTYTYYYVRVEQADKDIAVTAPVWASEATMVGLSKVEVAQDPMFVNTENTIEAGVYNNGQSILAEAEVSFYINEIGEKNKIGVEKVTNIAPGGEAKASIKWTPNEAGSYTIWAQSKLMVNGVEKIFTVSTKVFVAKEGELAKIVIDGAHGNAYVTGNYPDKIENLKTLSRENEYMLVVNKEPITASVLKDTEILILTDPASKDDKDNKYKKAVYSADEVAAIKAFVEKGGNVIITSAADYGDVTGEYGNAAQSNKVLEAIGANVRFNDDQVIDNVKNGGQAYRLYFDQYASDKYHLTNRVEAGETYSFYSGNSVILKENGDDSHIDWVVQGHSTTESNDADKQGDNVPVKKGEVKALAAEILPNGGKVVAGGTAFFSDFETAAGDNRYANRQIIMNILDWMVGPEEAPFKKIADIKVDSNNDEIPDLAGEKVTIEGYVTAQSEAVKPKNAFFEVIYIQDETGGTTVFGVSATPLELGTKVRITGIVGQYENDSQIQIKNEIKNLVILNEPKKIIAPTQMKTAEAMLEQNEGLLVEVEGIVKRIVTEKDNALYIDDGSGEARVYLNGYIGDGSGNQENLGKWDPRIKVGDRVKAIGLAAEDMVGPRIRVRNTKEIIRISNEKPEITIESIVLKDLNQKTVETVKENEFVNIWVKTDNTTTTLDTNGTLLVKIQKEGTPYRIGFVNKAEAYQGVYALGFDTTEMSKGQYTVEVYYWDSLSGMKPIADKKAMTFEIE